LARPLLGFAFVNKKAGEGNVRCRVCASSPTVTEPSYSGSIPHFLSNKKKPRKAVFFPAIPPKLGHDCRLASLRLIDNKTKTPV